MRSFKLSNDADLLIRQQRKAAEAYEAYVVKLAEVTKLLNMIQTIEKPDWVIHAAGLQEVMQEANAKIDLAPVCDDDILVDVLVQVFDDQLETAADIRLSELMGDFLATDLSGEERKGLADLLRQWADEAERP